MGDDTNPNSVIEEIMESPEKLRDLDLDAFAEELERQVCVCAHACTHPHACACVSVSDQQLSYICTMILQSSKKVVDIGQPSIKITSVIIDCQW